MNIEGDYGAIAMETVYGFYSPGEFVAEFISNPMFCDILKQIPAMKEKQFNNLFDEVIHWICKVVSDFFNNKPNSSSKSINLSPNFLLRGNTRRYRIY